MEAKDLDAIKYEEFKKILNERECRLIFASEAKSIGRGGISYVAKKTGLSRSTLTIGINELKAGLAGESEEKHSIRKPGGGRKRETEKHAGLDALVDEVVSPHTAGDPMNPLLWTSKSLRKIVAAVEEKGKIKVSHETIAKILRSKNYSLQGNRKTDEGKSHEDRDAQFEYINEKAAWFLSTGNPLISVDCKKKEVLGNLKSAGQEWLPRSSPTKVKVYDFEDKELGKAIPYEVYDVGNNMGWVNVGVSHDTASFAVASIRTWWEQMGKVTFEQAEKLYITADGGGSNSSRSRLWKKELQVLANEINKEIEVSHFPPGTSKWNKIEHRMFSYISMNWKAKPLLDLQVVVDLIAATTTTKGLKIKAGIDKNFYPTKQKVSDEELSKINILKNEFHGEWNYSIKPDIA